MTNGNDDEPEKPKLKLVTDSSGSESSGDGGDSGSNVVALGYFGDEPEEPYDNDEIVDILKYAAERAGSRPVSSITHELLRKDIEYVMAALNVRERSILELRFGLMDGKTRSLDEVAVFIGTTKERIGQLEMKALKKLRHPNRHLRSYPRYNFLGVSSQFNDLTWHELQSKLSQFKSFDRRILKMLWGFIDGQSLSISKVAQMFEVSDEYVVELDKQARKIFE